MTVQFDFSGKTVFVAGGTSGINYGVAKGFARWGAKVVVASRKQDKVDAAVAGLKELGADAAGFAFDVRDFDAVTDGLAQAVDFFGAS
ncbi:MAG: SDR family NAD(P)-dependent oxidoreductase, partial [Pseudomonadota bacterium]